MGACHFGHWVFLTLCLLAIFPGLQAGIICCSPKFTASGGVTAFFPPSKTIFSRNLVRHYNPDAEKRAEIMLNGTRVESKTVQIHGDVFSELGGKCLKTEFHFYPECLSDSFRDVTSAGGSGDGGSGDGGSGDGSGEGGSGQMKTWSHVFVHPIAKFKVTTILHVDDNCLLHRKIVSIENAHGAVQSMTFWEYTYDSVGSVTGEDPFDHCRPREH